MTLGSTARSWGEALVEGRLGRLPSSAWLTVVKQMLYSWMMEGYRLLKSSSSTNLSYRPFLGSRTSPPAYWGALRFLPPPPASTHADFVFGQALARHVNVLTAAAAAYNYFERCLETSPVSICKRNVLQAAAVVCCQPLQHIHLCTGSV